MTQHNGRLFASFWMAGFECASFLYKNGERRDFLRDTFHDECVGEDYLLMQRHGMQTVRDGLRWHLIETAPYHYDWSSVLPMLKAARATGTQVLWDLTHYGFPDGLGPWDADFVERFSRYAREAVKVIRDETEGTPFVCPMNEISYWALQGAETGYMFPFARNRGGDMKAALVRACIAGIDSIREVCPEARIVYAEPIIHTHGQPDLQDEAQQHAAMYNEAQFEAFDWLGGYACPELGGKPEYLDIIGINYYPSHQWWLADGQDHKVLPGDAAYKPPRDLFREVYARYGRPMFISETGYYNVMRPEWIRHICGEVLALIREGFPLHGMCYYPVFDHPTWEDHVRIIDHGRFDGMRKDRPGYAPALEEWERQQRIFAREGVG